MSITVKNFWLFLIILTAISSSCEYNSIPILRGLPDDISYLSLTQNSSSNTVIANGKNQIQFTINGFDVNKAAIPNYKIGHFDQLKIEIDGVTELSYPFTFSTTVPGGYSFKIKGLSQKSSLSEPIKIMAIDDIDYELTTLAVIFHFISKNNLSAIEKDALQELLNNNINEVNKAFMNQKNSYDPNATNSYIQFKMAIVDPGGKALEQPGLNFIYSSTQSFGTLKDSNIDDLIWDGNFWAPKEYLNIWIAPLDDNFSWAYYPDLNQSVSDFPSKTYGVVYNSKHIANYGVLTHEFGHALNLRHVFDAFCGDDLCSDTWNYRRDYYDFKTSWQIYKTTCSGISFYSNNYMDYYPSANNTFSRQQVLRMQNTIAEYPFLPIAKNSINGRKEMSAYSKHSMRKGNDRDYRIY